MPTNWKKRAAWGLVLGLIVAGLAWFAWPQPISGGSRDCHERADGGHGRRRGQDPRASRLHGLCSNRRARFSGFPIHLGEQGISVHVGDQVKAAETVVAIMQPTVPSFLDVRSREELQAMLTAADAAVALAEAEVRRIEAALEFSRSELRRSEALARTNSIPERTLEKARLDVRTNEAALASAKAQLDVRRSERAVVAARLIDPSTATPAETERRTAAFSYVHR